MTQQTNEGLTDWTEHTMIVPFIVLDINTPDASLNTMCRTVSPIVPLVLTNTIILESIPSQPLRVHPTSQRYEIHDNTKRKKNNRI